MNSMSKHQRIYAIVRQIPPGCVSTYGDVATLAGLPGHARLVGYALHALPEFSDVPWQRVINAKGAISLGRAYPGGELRQRHLLEAEGVEFDANGKVELKRFRWRPERVALPDH
ncbi:MAG: MGMT family protein [Gammaproteobacteria bacterium]|nr:MGMT family protein [Gammaproteobacteria bacterium]MBU1722682.1 MGMT family protein [Gammaproteobacteria bacterium]MBU2006560.1 MGMT family protein [Gammaproteobacteria bacterium]